MLGSFAKVTSVYLHGADAPSWGYLERGKGPFRGSSCPRTSQRGSAHLCCFVFLTALFRGTLFLIYMYFFFIFNLVAFWQQNFPLLWGLYNPKVGIIMKFHLVQVSLNCVF